MVFKVYIIYKIDDRTDYDDGFNVETDSVFLSKEKADQHLRILKETNTGQCIRFCLEEFILSDGVKIFDKIVFSDEESFYIQSLLCKRLNDIGFVCDYEYKMVESIISTFGDFRLRLSRDSRFFLGSNYSSDPPVSVSNFEK